MSAIQEKTTVTLALGVILAMCFLAGTSGLPYNAMPALLGSAADRFSLSAIQIGSMGSSILAGWVVAGIAMSMLLHRISWRFATGCAVLISSVSISASAFLQDAALLNVCAFGFGFGAAIPTCIAYEAMSRMDNKERAFGLMTGTGIAFSAIVLYVFPAVIEPNFQYRGVALGFALVMLPMLFAIPFIPRDKLAHHSGNEQKAHGLSEKNNIWAWLVLLGFIVFFSGQSGLWAFMERVGRDVGATSVEIGLTLSILKAIGAVASVVVVLVSDRLGRYWPHILTFVGLSVGVYFLSLSTSFREYAGGSWVWEFFFTTGYCYGTAMVARMDRTGRCVALIPSAVGIGGMIGPRLAGELKGDSDGYGPIFIYSAVAMGIAALIYIASARNEVLEPDLLPA